MGLIRNYLSLQISAAAQLTLLRRVQNYPELKVPIIKRVFARLQKMWERSRMGKIGNNLWVYSVPGNKTCTDGNYILPNEFIYRWKLRVLQQPLP
jgi:hypothetical protein